MRVQGRKLRGSMVFASIGYTMYFVATKGSAGAEAHIMAVYPLFLLAGGIGVGLLFTLVSFLPAHEEPRSWIITSDA